MKNTHENILFASLFFINDMHFEFIVVNYWCKAKKKKV